MFILPYSSGLTLAKKPLASYAIALILVIVFYLQTIFPIVSSLVYYADSWNPLKMVSTSFVHGNLFHLIVDIIFFIVFAPVLEVLLLNKLRYLWVILFLSLVSGTSYSLLMLSGDTPPWPILGFSGIVVGLIGLSANLAAGVQIKTFFWFFQFWRTFYIPGWIMALVFIAFDAWLSYEPGGRGFTILYAHLIAGIIGYLYGLLFLGDLKQETREELAIEMKEMQLEKKHGKSASMSSRGQITTIKQKAAKIESQNESRWMSQVYKMVMAHRDSDAVAILVANLDYEQSSIAGFEILFKRIEEWGPSRTMLCMGRLLIGNLDAEKRYGRALYFIRKCIEVSPKFILPDDSKTLFYARLAIENELENVAAALIDKSQERYGERVDNELCRELAARLSSR